MRSLSVKEAREVPIVDYLASLGHEPATVRHGHDYWYYAPYRNERTPSFKVNAKRNVWYDHGIGKGGSILELGIRIHGCTLLEFVDRLSASNISQSPTIERRPRIDPPKSRLDIFSVSDGFNPNLLLYLDQRGIDETIAKQYCKEAEFCLNNRMYTAIAFPNRSGAFELRNTWFKGSSAPKDISFIQNNHQKLNVFEGFMDFLSVHQLNTFRNHQEFEKLTAHSNYLVLNSIALLKKSLDIMKAHTETILFLDNDLAAEQAKDLVRRNAITFQDAGHLFTGHKDVNEYLQAVRKSMQGHPLHLSRSKGLSR